MKTKTVERLMNETPEHIKQQVSDYADNLVNRIQSSIDWLVDQIKNEDHHTEGELGNSCIDVNTLLMLCEQAKAMHKEEIESAWVVGYDEGIDHANGEPSHYESSQQYYNETFGGNNE